jgi:hypothetical protein
MQLTSVWQYDLHICAYTALLRVVARFHDDIFSDPLSPSGLNKVCFSGRIEFRADTASVAHRLPVGDDRA